MSGVSLSKSFLFVLYSITSWISIDNNYMITAKDQIITITILYIAIYDSVICHL